VPKAVSAVFEFEKAAFPFQIDLNPERLNREPLNESFFQQIVFNGVDPLGRVGDLEGGTLKAAVSFSLRELRKSIFTRD
jgi:hypothetical protein